ncbi:MAG: carboxymuconolactone decarboxylase family protein [Deltaproteobacteria bacterium]
MSRIAALSDDTATPDALQLFAGLKVKLGMVPNLYRVAGNQPAVLEALLTLGATLDKGAFSASDVEAIALTAAGANDCDYCASAHTMVSQMQKRDSAEIAANVKGQSSNARTAAILKLARAILDTKGRVSDATLSEARLAGLSDADLVETIAQVVRNIFTNYLNHVAETEIDFPRVAARAA